MPVDAPESLRSHGTGDHQRPLPHRLRLLLIGAEEPPWALLALRLEKAGCDHAAFDWEQNSTTALARLRKAAFDCVIVSVDGASPVFSTAGGRVRSEADGPAIAPAGISLHPGDGRPRTSTGIARVAGHGSDRRCASTAADSEHHGCLAFAEALRASGSEDPVVVIAARPDDERSLHLEQLNCDHLVTAAGWHSRALVATIRRAIAGRALDREVSDLEVTKRRGRLREREEAESHLQELRSVVARVGRQEPPAAESARQREIGAKIDRCYQEVLRTYVMMGSGNLAGELEHLAELLSLAGISPVGAMSIHLEQVETLLQGLGSRSTRYVMGRADLLVVELLILLSQRFRHTPTIRGLGDAGIDLLHAESLLQRD